MSNSIAGLRVTDLLTFLVVRRIASLSAAARELKVTPSQVSKAIARLEGHLGVQLFTRTQHGVALMEAGRRIAPTIEDAVERLRQLERPIDAPPAPLTIAAPPYLIARVIPRIALAVPDVRLRILEAPPALIRVYATQNAFDVAILPSAPERIRPPWIGTRVGELESALYATPKVAKRLGTQPLDANRLRSIPFIAPITDVHGLFAPVSDDCPLDVASRAAGHEAQTITTALRLAVVTGQLVFGPRLAASEHLKSGALVEIEVLGWSVKEPLFVACNHDRVLASIRASVVSAVSEALRD